MDTFFWELEKKQKTLTFKLRPKHQLCLAFIKISLGTYSTTLLHKSKRIKNQEFLSMNPFRHANNWLAKGVCGICAKNGL